MKTPTILSTNNFSLFSPHEYQQPMSQKHVEALAANMRVHGFSPSSAVRCWKDDDGKLHLIDGHHRVKGAEEAGCFVYYTIVPEEEKYRIGDWNFLLKKWKNSSFVEMFCKMEMKGEKQGDHYQVLRSFMNRGIPLDILATLLSGSLSAGGATISNEALRGGNFKVKNTSHVAALLKVIAALGEACPRIRTGAYLFSISACLLVEDFDLDLFIHRARMNSTLILPCATRDQALAVVCRVYNKQAKGQRVDDLELRVKASLRNKKREVFQGNVKKATAASAAARKNK